MLLNQIQNQNDNQLAFDSINIVKLKYQKEIYNNIIKNQTKIKEYQNKWFKNSF